MDSKIQTQVVVLGAGPAGYSAAFRCADLGFETIIVERYNVLGGVCLNVGCIPSKALLHIAKIIAETTNLSKKGVFFENLKIDINQIRIWKEKVVNQIAYGLTNLAIGRKVKIINGLGKFIDVNNLEVKNQNGKTIISFDNAVIATGSRPIKLPCIPYDDPRVWDSSDALDLREIPKRMLVIGGGIIGLEISTIYHALGSEIDIVEVCDQILPSVDKDIAETFIKILNKKFNFLLETEVVSVEARKEGIFVSMKGKEKSDKLQCYDVVLVAIGREPNSKNLDISKAKVEVDNRGFICVDNQLRTSVPNIFAVGDIVGQPMLAHKGIHEGHIAAEVISGMHHYFDSKVIPSVAYTNPEIAWVGLNEEKAKEKDIRFKSVIFPWAASGRAIASDCDNGITKLIFNKETQRIIGGAVIGANSSEILGEIGLAVEMGCDAEDIALTIHAHPTLHESIGLSAEIFKGIITDLPNIRSIE